MTEPNQQLVEADEALSGRRVLIACLRMNTDKLSRDAADEIERLAAIQATDECQKLRSALEYARNVIVAIAPTSPLRTEAIENIDATLKEQSA